MAGKIQTIVRTVEEISDDSPFESIADPSHLVHWASCKIKTYRENPFLANRKLPCQLIGVKDGKVVGRRNSYPSQFVANGVVYNCRNSGAVYVDPAARSSLLAISLLAQALKFPNGELNINCYLSAQNQKFYRFLGSAMFPLLEFDAGGRWSGFYRRGKYRGLKAVVAKTINVAVAVCNHFFDERRWRNLPNWTIRRMDSSDEDFLKVASELVMRDRHCYRENITPEWIKWTLTNDFNAASWKKEMFGVFNGKDLVGFALSRFDLSTCCVKIYEWQVDHKYEVFECEFLSLIAKELYHYGVRVRIAVAKDGSGLEDKMKGRFPLVGSNYAVVTIAEDSEFNGLDGIKNVENWRVRPGMGDAPFW